LPPPIVLWLSGQLNKIGELLEKTEEKGIPWVVRFVEKDGNGGILI